MAPTTRVENAQIAKLHAEEEELRAKTRLHTLQARAAEIELSDVEAGLDHNGTFVFYNPIVSVTVMEAMRILDRWSRRDGSAKPITIVFNSPGGTVTDGFMLYDFIQDLRRRGHHVTTKCMGLAASMGAILMQSGDERVMSENSFLMVHKVSSKLEGDFDDLSDGLKLLEKFQDKGLNILAGRATATRDEIDQRWTRTDWYMDAYEAVARGFADRVE